MVSCGMESARATEGANELVLCLDILSMPKPGNMPWWLLLSAV